MIEARDRYMANLHTQYAISDSKITKADELTYSYMKKSEGIYDDEAIRDVDNWQVFYNLSVLRTGIISWYDFGEDANVLEVGAGFGAVTGKLCELCGHVTATERSAYRAQAITERLSDARNLDVYAGDVLDMDFTESFDVIVLVGILERVGGGSMQSAVYSGYLEKLMPLLKKEGRILIAVENRMGLRYFCGAVEPHTNRAYDGLNHYPGGTKGRSFSRSEAAQIVAEAGLHHARFYYPLPDYKLPQLIYSDSYLPENNLRERLIPYYRRNDTLLASEQELYRDVIENGVFPFFSNSFLVECSREELPVQTVYAAVSTDRGRERSYATMIKDDGRVLKRPLWREGEPNARKLYENINDLRIHGIPVIELSQHADTTLEMPYISWPTLSNYLKTLRVGDRDTFMQIINRVYKNILRSSDLVDASHNALRSRCKGTMPGEIDFGPILARAYIELIPLNCFYDEESQQFLYFDQEFVRENYPAGYVLFRAIHYIYCFGPNAEHICPKQELIAQYGLEDTWDIYMTEEQCFLDEVRKRDTYSQFYQWTKIDRKRMLDNAKRLESEEETIAQYKISDKMKKIWKVELQIYDEVARICKENHLTFYLVHGSLLGAVRHKGFIPWDDDLDIAMPRADYDRFLALAERELKEPLSVHTPMNETDMFWGGFARIRNGQTTGIETRQLGHQGNQGIWVDILPLDVCTTQEGKLERKLRQIQRAQRLLYAKIYGRDQKQYADMAPLVWNFYRLRAAFFSRRKLGIMLDKAMKLYTDEPTDDVAFFSGYGKCRRLHASDFAGVTQLEFEGRKVPVPVGYENYLFMSMGKDYMKYPPAEERKPKHQGIYDPDKPYEEYTKLFGELLEDVQGRQIVLFGAGLMFEDYMEKYGRRYRPAYLIDNDENKWGRYRMGIEICNPDKLLELPESKRKIIICSYYYREISEQLDKMGIHDYQVYVQRAEWILKTEENS